MPYIPSFRLNLRTAPLDISAAGMVACYAAAQAINVLLSSEPAFKYRNYSRKEEAAIYAGVFCAAMYYGYRRCVTWEASAAPEPKPEPILAPILPHIFDEDCLKSLHEAAGPYDPWDYDYWATICEYLRSKTNFCPAEILKRLFKHFAITCGSPLWPSRKLLNARLNMQDHKAQANIRWAIVEYFLRLTITQDYENQPERMSALYLKILFDVCGETPNQKTFCQFFIHAISGELESCSDRTAASFNVVHTRWRMIQEPESNAQQELRELISIAKVLTLREGIAHVLSAHERETQKEVEESVHVHVFYEHALNDQLDLRSPTHFLLASDSFFARNPTETLLAYVEAHYFSKLQELERFQALISKCRVAEFWKASANVLDKIESATTDDFNAKQAMQKALLQTNLWH